MTTSRTPRCFFNEIPVLVVLAIVLAVAPAVWAQVAPPGFSKAFSPSIIQAGGTATLTFTIDNTVNGADVYNLDFSDTMPAGMVVATPSSASESCGEGGIVTAVSGSGTIVYSGGFVDASGTCTVSVDVTSSTPGMHVNTSGDLTSDAGNSGPATATLTVGTISDVGFSKGFFPDTIGPGSTSQLRFDISNIESDTLVTDLAFTDVLPAGIALADPPSASTDCVNGVVVLGDDPESISLSGGTLGANEECSVTVNVIGTATATNTSGNLTSSDGSSGAAVATLTVDDARVGFSKSFAPASIPLGGTSTLTFDLTNDDAAQIFSVSFADSLPDDMVVATPANVSNTCIGALTAVPGTPAITFFSGVLAAMSSCAITVDVTTVSTGVFVNTTQEVQGGLQAQESGGFATAALNVPIDFLNKVFLDDPVAPGGAVTLLFTIQNPDRVNAATAIAFDDPLPAGLTFASLVSDDCGGVLDTATPSLLSYSGGSLAGGASCSLNVVLTVPSMTADGTYTNTTNPITATIDGDGVTGNTATDELVVSPAPTLTKEFLSNPVGTGGATTLRFTITNTSTSSSLTDIAFVDIFDDVLKTASAVPLNPVCNGGTATFTPFVDGSNGSSNSPATFTVTGASLAASQSCTIALTLDVVSNAAAGIYPNTTTGITGMLGGEEPVEGLPATDDLVVVGGPSLLKQFSGDPVNPPGPVTLSFTLSHSDVAGGPATGISFTDDLTFLTDLTAVGLPLTEICDPDGPGGIPGTGTLSGTTVLDFSGGSLAPGESCFFSVTLDVPGSATPGPHTNTTSAVTATVGGFAVTGNSASDDLQVATLTLSKEFTDDPVIAGDTTNLRFTLTNATAAPVTGISFSDSLAAILPGTPDITVDGAPPTAPCGGTLTSIAPTFLLFTGGSVPANSTCSFDVSLLVPAGIEDGTYINTSSAVTSSLGAGDPAIDALIVNSTIIDLSKAFDNPAAPGDTKTLRFTITNLSSVETLTDIAFSDDLDAAMPGLLATGLPVAGCGGTASTSDGGMTVDFAGGGLGPSGTCFFDVSVSVPVTTVGSQAVNTTSGVTGLTAGQLAVFGTPATDTLRIGYLTLDKAFDGPVKGGDSVGLSFTLGNLGDTAVGDLGFSDDLEAVIPGLAATGLPIAACGGVLFTPDGGSTVILAGGSLAAAGSPGDSCTFPVTLELPVDASPGTYTNTTSDLLQSGISVGDPAVADLVVESALGFSKAFQPDTIGPGGSSQLVFTISNPDSSTLVEDLAFTDILPSGVTIATPSSAFTDCVGGVVNAPDGGAAISLTGGTLGVDSSCSVTVNVLGAATATNVSGELASSVGVSAVATATLTVDPALPGFSKSFAPSTIPLGGTSVLTFTVDNSANPTDLYALSFSDVLPTGMIVATPANAATDCSSDLIPANLTADPGTNVISLFANGFSGLTTPVVAAGAVCTVTVDVTTETNGVFVNTSGELLAGSSNEPSGFATASLDVPVQFLVKSFTDDPVAPGGTVTLEFRVTNLDRSSPASNISFDDDIDPLGSLTGLTPAEMLPKPACDGTLDFAAGTLSFTGGSLPAAGFCTFSVQLLVPAMADTGTFTNTTDTITADIDGNGVTGNMATDDLVVSYSPVLTKEFTDDPVGAGSTVTLEFTITNTNPSLVLGDIAFTDELTTFLPFPVSVTAPTPDPPCGGGSALGLISLGTERQALALTGGSLAASGMCTFSVTLTVPPGVAAGTYTNVTSEIAGVIDTCGDGCFEPVSGLPASDDLVVIAAPSLVKQFTDDPVQPGATVTLEFTLTHDEFAPGDATDITFTDDLGATLSGLVATGLPMADVCGMGSEIDGTTNLSFTGGTLAPGQSCTFSVTLDVPDPAAAGSYTNTTSSVVATVLGVTATENAAEDDLQIAGLVLSKLFLDDPVLPGDTVVLRFTIDNTSPAAATGVFFEDYLDPDVLVGLTAVALPPTSPCGAGSTLVTFDPPGPSVEGLRLTGGDLAPAGSPGDSCTFDVTLEVPASTPSGVYTNRTSSFFGIMDAVLTFFANATDDLSVSNDLLYFTKEFTDDPAAPGGTVTLDFTLTNLAPEAVVDLEFSDDLDATLAGLFATGLPISACGGTLLSPDGGSTLTFAGGSLAAAGSPGDSCTFGVTLQVPSDVPPGTSFTNTTSPPTGTLGIEGPLVTGAPASDDLQIDFLNLTKSFSYPTVAGATVTLDFTISNLDASSGVADLEFSDDLDAVISGLAAVPGPPVIDVCGVGSVLDGTSFLTVTGANLLPGGSCTFSVTLDVPATATPGLFGNTTSDLFMAGLMVASPAVADLEIIGSPLEITKTALTPQVVLGSPASFSIALRNLGTAALTDVQVSDPLTPDCDRLVGELSDLAASDSISYTCTTAPLLTDLVNEATAVAAITGGPIISESATAMVQVISPSIQITKMPAFQQIDAGGTASFTIEVSNVGDGDLINVAVGDALTPDCARDAGILPSLPPGQSTSYTCQTDPLGADLINVATAEADSVGHVPVSASASAVVEVTLPLAISKTPPEQEIFAGDAASFTITVSNPSSNAKSNVAVADPLTPDCNRAAGVLGDLAPGASVSYDCSTGPLFASFTNVASAIADGPSGPVAAMSSAFVAVFDPPISITKTPDVQVVSPGSPAAFTVTVSNPGDDVLSNVAVVDPLTPDCDRAAGTLADLAAGESLSYGCATGPLFSDFTNVATTTATTAAGPQVDASASALVNVLNPIEIFKTPSEQLVPYGSAATFTITLINDGDDPKTGVAVLDPLTPDCERAAGTIPDLEANGGSYSYTCVTAPLTVDLLNEATVTADGAAGQVSAMDTAFADVLPQELVFSKTPLFQQIDAGDVATFTISLSNAGASLMTGIEVLDAATPSCERALGTLPDLAAGESLSYTCDTAPLFLGLVNVATVTATLDSEVLTSSATAEVEVIQPLEITKLPPEQEILVGATATFTITVSNPSTVVRSNVAVADPITPDCDRPVGMLPNLGPGQSVSYDCQTVPLVNDLTNVATATADGPTGPASATASAVVRVISPPIEISKTPPVQLVALGDPASFTITVSNPGATDLFDVEVLDALTPDCDRPAGALGNLLAGSATSYTCLTAVPPLADFTNVATASAQPPVGPTVSASAAAFVNVVNPIEIVKGPPVQAVPPGGAAVFTITVTNDTDTVRTNVAVDDPLTPDCSRPAGTLPDLAPGGGSFSYVCATVPLFAGFTNQATVTADSPGGQVSAIDTAQVFMVWPNDYGDAPAPYPTLEADGGARHTFVEGFVLGALADTEPDGLPSPDASGDDSDALDDEDGVILPGMLLAGDTVTIDVIASQDGLLDAWIDFNANGDWSDAGEQIFASEALVAGVNSLGLTVPAGPGGAVFTFARFRFSSAGGLAPDGPAADGEVEDYQVEYVGDDVPPTVTLVNKVTDAGFGELVDCETVTANLFGFEVSFSEEMFDPPGDSDPDDVSNPANYLLVGSGVDAEFQTDFCGMLSGDDVAVPFAGATYTAGVDTVDLGLGDLLGPSQYRLLVCGSTSVTDLAGNPLNGGSDFMLGFRADPFNLFANGHLDCDIAGWDAVSADPMEIDFASDDVDDSSTSGSLHISNLAMNVEFEVSQCLPLTADEGYRLGGSVRLDAAPGDTVQLVVGCDFLDQAGCTGTSAGTRFTAFFLDDTAGQWLPVEVDAPAPSGTVSARCGYTVRTAQPLTFDLYLDALYMRPDLFIFTDGFESGDTSAWSATVP